MLHSAAFCYIICITCPTTVHLSVDWRVGVGNLSHAHPKFPVNEQTELLVPYNVRAFKLGAFGLSFLWEVPQISSLSV